MSDWNFPFPFFLFFNVCFYYVCRPILKIEAHSRQDEIETFFTNYIRELRWEGGGTAREHEWGLRILSSKSNQFHDVINNATFGIASKRDESHTSNTGLLRMQRCSINLHKNKKKENKRVDRRCTNIPFTLTDYLLIRKQRED